MSQKGSSSRARGVGVVFRSPVSTEHLPRAACWWFGIHTILLSTAKHTKGWKSTWLVCSLSNHENIHNEVHSGAHVHAGEHLILPSHWGPPRVRAVSKHIRLGLISIDRKQQGPCIKLIALSLTASEFTSCLLFCSMIYFLLHWFWWCREELACSSPLAGFILFMHFIFYWWLLLACNLYSFQSCLLSDLKVSCVQMIIPLQDKFQPTCWLVIVYQDLICVLRCNLSQTHAVKVYKILIMLFVCQL